MCVCPFEDKYTIYYLRDPLALSYLKPLREAERAGYTMDEMLLALKIVPAAGLENWLATSYVEMVKHLADFAANIPNVLFTRSLLFISMLSIGGVGHRLIQ